MITSLLFLFILIAFILNLFNRKKAANYALMLNIFLFIFIGCGMLSTILLPMLQDIKKQDVIWGKNNAIVLLGAGTVLLPESNSLKPAVLAYSRIHEAAKNYFACKKLANTCQIIISGGDASKTGESEAVVYQNELLKLGINKKDLILEDKSLNTFKNAEFTSEILKSHSYDKVYLVTSGLHMKRALIYFAHFGIFPVPLMSDYISPIVTVIPIGFNFAIADFVAHEYTGIVRLYVYNFLGWNKVSIPNQAKIA